MRARHSILPLVALAISWASAQTRPRNDSEAAVAFELGRAAYEAHDFEQAETELSRARDMFGDSGETQPQQQEAAYIHILTLARLGRPGLAVAELRDAKVLDSDEVTSSGRFKTFRAELETVLREQIESYSGEGAPPCVVRRAILGRAELAGLKQSGSDPYDAFDKARELFDAHLDKSGAVLAILLERQSATERKAGRFEMAQRYLHEALEIVADREPTAPIWRYSLFLKLAETHLAAQEWDAARQAFDEAHHLARVMTPEPHTTPFIDRAVELATSYGSESIAKEWAVQAELEAENAGLYRIGGATRAPGLTTKQEPQYTGTARFACLQGTVILSIEVWPDGRAHRISVERGLGAGLDDAAVRAVSGWRFRPATRYGEAVRVKANVEVSFRLL